MRTFISTIALLALVATLASAQTSYNDVLVIVNSNSQLSIDVGNYFKSARAIPNANVCSIAMPTTEEITGAQFSTIVTSIKSYMTAHGLTASINYIVTTQGVPLKVRRSLSVNPPSGGGYSDASSFDSDLCLMNSNREAYIGNAGYTSNPYYMASANFSRTATYQNIYLVTRLAGLNYSNICQLINRGVMPYYSSGKFVFDRDPSKSSYTIDNNMATASSTVASKGYSTLLNTTSTYVTNQEDVLGYVSWGSNDSYWSMYTQKANPHINFSPKALAETYVSSSGRTFTDTNFVESTIGWQSLVVDLLGPTGVTGVKGYVFEPYTFAMANVNVLFDRWTAGKTLAESFYSASYCLGWMDVVVGDPKAKFGANGHLPVELTAFKGQFMDKYIKLEWNTATENNNYGFEVEKQIGNDWTSLGFVDGHGTTNAPQSYSFADDKPLAENVYRLKQIDRNGKFEYSQMVSVAGRTIDGFSLNQNYPNPFNPVTSISYNLPMDAAVTVQIFSVDGRLVRTLAQDLQNSPGTQTLFWDGKDESNSLVSTGAYFYRISASVNGAPQFSAVRQMTLAK